MAAEQDRIRTEDQEAGEDLELTDEAAADVRGGVPKKMPKITGTGVPNNKK
jgi:hypothetical protein